MVLLSQLKSSAILNTKIVGFLMNINYEMIFIYKMTSYTSWALGENTQRK